MVRVNCKGPMLANLSFETLLRPIYIFNSVDTTKLLCETPTLMQLKTKTKEGN